MVSGGIMAKFVHFKDGNLIYSVNKFLFPVPVEDTGNGVFPAEVKAITLMRWIRRQLKEQENF